jgi:hypothetical protein
VVGESIRVGTVVKNLPDKEMEILLACLLLIVTMFISNCNELRMPSGKLLQCDLL